MNKTFCHDLPPSVVRKTPRSVFGPQACPRAATNATLASRGFTMTAPICPVSSKPTCCQFVQPKSASSYCARPVIGVGVGFSSGVGCFFFFSGDCAGSFCLEFVSLWSCFWAKERVQTKIKKQVITVYRVERIKTVLRQGMTTVQLSCGSLQGSAKD